MARRVLQYSRVDATELPYSGPARASFIASCVAAAEMPLLFAATHLPGWRDRDGLQIAITALIGISLISAVVLGMISLFDHGYRWRLGVYGLLISAADFCALILINLTMTA